MSKHIGRTTNFIKNHIYLVLICYIMIFTPLGIYINKSLIIVDAFPKAYSPEVGGIGDMILIYSEGNKGRNFTEDNFKKLLVHYNTNNGKPDFGLFDGFLFMSLYEPQSGMSYYPGFGSGAPANSSVWFTMLDKWFKKGQDIYALNKAIEELKDPANYTQGDFKLPQNFTAKVVICVPYPEKDLKTFGKIQFLNGVNLSSNYEPRNLDFSKDADRIEAVKAYIEYAEYLIGQNSANLTNIEFKGYYWLLEHIRSEDYDLVRAYNEIVHSYSRKSYWIPYFMANGHDKWRFFGFDAASLQPNLFFDNRRDYKTSLSRINYTSDVAHELGLGVEFECDETLFSNTSDEIEASFGKTRSEMKERLLYAYLYSGVQKGQMQAYNTYYTGVHSFEILHDFAFNVSSSTEKYGFRLNSSELSRFQRIYNDFSYYIHGNLSIDPELSNYLLTDAFFEE
ncbi:MAG: DUF4855 domain-containing protein [Promethearchaeota archaeon]